MKNVGIIICSAAVVLALTTAAQAANQRLAEIEMEMDFERVMNAIYNASPQIGKGYVYINTGPAYKEGGWPKVIEDFNRLKEKTWIKEKFPEMLIDAEKRIPMIEERYAADKKKYDIKKEKYREQLLKIILADGILENYIYSEPDDNILICIKSIKVKRHGVIATINIFPAYPLQFNDIFDLLWQFKKGTPGKYIYLYNNGANLGSPVDTNCEAIGSNVGVAIRLTFEDNINFGEGKLKLIIQKWGCLNSKEVVMEIPYELKEVILTDSPLEVTEVNTSSVVKAEKDFISEIKTIDCKRISNHLLVPVSLNIHGKEVKEDMLLDTGASLTMISKKLYSQGNSKAWESLKKQSFETANGNILGYVDKMQVSTSAYAKEIEVAISENDTALLGVNYFEGVIFTVDLENELIYIHPLSR